METGGLDLDWTESDMQVEAVRTCVFYKLKLVHAIYPRPVGWNIRVDCTHALKALSSHTIHTYTTIHLYTYI